MRRLAPLLLAPPVLALAACASRAEAPAAPHEAAILTDHGRLALPAWTAEELAKPVAPRRLGGDEHHTEFLIHLGTAEKPHTHDNHDLSVTLIAGAGRIHIGETVADIHPGDVMRIPRGVPHWAESTAPGGSVAYAVFTPAYDGSDNHPLPAAPAH